MEERQMRIGDVVIPRRGVILRCGSGMYSHAVVGSVDPFVLVSSHGDMVWNCTVELEQFERVGIAEPAVLVTVLNRLRRTGEDIREKPIESEI